MNCINCSLEISPGFVASIRDNRCPACGKACLSDADHGAIFSVVSLITSSVTDMAEDAAIKLATALHGKFDIFPKGVVVDGQATKEIVYVSTGSSPQSAAGMRRPAPLPVRKARVGPEQATPELPGEQLTAAQLSKLRQFQQLQEQTVDVEEDESVLFDNPLGEELRDAEAVRFAKQKIDKLRAERAGIKG